MGLRNRMFSLSNSLKASRGRVEALHNEQVMARRADAERRQQLKPFSDRVRAVDKAGNVGPWQHTRVEIPTPRPNLV